MSDGKQESGSHFVNVQQLDWQPTRFPGIAMKILWQDEQGLAFTGLFRCEAGSELPLHRHVDIEQTYVGVLKSRIRIIKGC